MLNDHEKAEEVRKKCRLAAKALKERPDGKPSIPLRT